jgi:peptide/nickel transport system permease protein
MMADPMTSRSEVGRHVTGETRAEPILQRSTTPRLGRWRTLLALLGRDPVALVAAGFLGLVLLAALFGPSIIGSDATKMNLSLRNQPPFLSGGSLSHVFGTDPLGRDLLGRIARASRVSLGIAVVVVVVSVLIGTVMGTLAGYFGGFWDDVVMRIVDVFMGFPSLLLVIVVIYAVGPGIQNLALVLIATRWMLYARVARADVLKLRRFEFVEAARAMGARHHRILLRHVAPNLIPTLLTLAILEVSAVILAEAGLSFLGLGVPENSWGRLIADGQKYITSAWWLVSFPGLAILLTTMSLAILANWIVVYLDPGQRARAFARLQPRKAR